MAIFQLAQAGTADQVAAAREVLTNARRALYGILAEDEPTEDLPRKPDPRGDCPLDRRPSRGQTLFSQSLPLSSLAA